MFYFIYLPNKLVFLRWNLWRYFSIHIHLPSIILFPMTRQKKNKTHFLYLAFLPLILSAKYNYVILRTEANKTKIVGCEKRACAAIQWRGNHERFIANFKRENVLFKVLPSIFSYRSVWEIAEERKPFNWFQWPLINLYLKGLKLLESQLLIKKYILDCYNTR